MYLIVLSGSFEFPSVAAREGSEEAYGVFHEWIEDGCSQVGDSVILVYQDGEQCTLIDDYMIQ